jgi:large subunit ribosomal protein L22
MAEWQVRAVSKYIKGSPLKMRRVANAVRGMPAKHALEVLKLLPQAAAVPIGKTIKSALANAEENDHLEGEDMVVTGIWIDEGPRWRRSRYGARGRFKPIRKRTSHITVVLETEETTEQWDDEE